ncbi:hypothetical protein [Algibacter sp. 2305UL17-15]|uniref:hypothetical protein n=1 Tax=Algibacter sp. 2305UL17-15 TaxID=3231268 RepID=UPI00345A23D6
MKLVNAYVELALKASSETQKNPVLQYSILLWLIFFIGCYFIISFNQSMAVFSMTFILPIVNSSVFAIKSIEIRNNQKANLPHRYLLLNQSNLKTLVKDVESEKISFEFKPNLEEELIKSNLINNKVIAHKALSMFTYPKNEILESFLNQNFDKLNKGSIHFTFTTGSDCLRILFALVNTGLITKLQLKSLCRNNIFKFDRDRSSYIEDNDIEKYWSIYMNKVKYDQTRNKKLKLLLKEFKITKDYFSES